MDSLGCIVNYSYTGHIGHAEVVSWIAVGHDCRPQLDVRDPVQSRDLRPGFDLARENDVGVAK